MYGLVNVNSLTTCHACNTICPDPKRQDSIVLIKSTQGPMHTKQSILGLAEELCFILTMYQF